MHVVVCIALTASILVFSGGKTYAGPVAAPEAFTGLTCFYKNHNDQRKEQYIDTTGQMGDDEEEILHRRVGGRSPPDTLLSTPLGVPLGAPLMPRFVQREGGEGGERGVYERCRVGDVCQTVWTEVTSMGLNDTTVTESVLQLAGCVPDQRDIVKVSCGDRECVSTSRHDSSPNHLGKGQLSKVTFICCCVENDCNGGYSVNDTVTARPPLSTTVGTPGTLGSMAKGKGGAVGAGGGWVTYLIGGGMAALGVLMLVGGAVMWRCCQREKKPEEVTLANGPNEINLSEAFPGRIHPDRSPVVAADVEVLDKVAFGRYGEVYKAKVGGQMVGGQMVGGKVVGGQMVGGKVVAVKKFSVKDREYFLNECRVYNLPFMEHDAVLRFLAATEVRDHTTGGVLEYWLVVDYHPNRTLTEFLKQNTIDGATLAYMALSLASGLSHLHLECTRDGITKPSVVHRDFNSRNILVRSDQRLCICDMGFALAIGSSLTDTTSESSTSHRGTSGGGGGGGGRGDEAPLLNDVGTVRYMAPEVLEGSLNLRDSGAALRQVDVYALGLVLWEMVMRCVDVYQMGVAVPEYQLPFQKEAGLRPTFPQMQRLVGKDKARPLFSHLWKGEMGLVKFLRDTMEECWDGDAEARLTAKCVEERLLELTASLGTPRIVNDLREEGVGVGEDGGGEEELLGVEEEEEPTEAMVLLTGADETVRVPTVKNVNELRDGNSVMGVASRLQPHQGRNPCFQRNVKEESEEELTTSGNHLISKKSGLRKNPSPPELSVGTRNRVIENAENALLGNRSDEKKARQKKVPNDLAAEQNRNGFFSFFKKNNDSNNLLKYRAVPVPATSSGSLLPRGSIPASMPITLTLDHQGHQGHQGKKANIETGAKLLPHVVRRDVLHEGSNSTQLTCLSPSPSTSTSGNSPPQHHGGGGGGEGRCRTSRFEVVGVESQESTLEADDVEDFSPPLPLPLQPATGSGSSSVDMP